MQQHVVDRENVNEHVQQLHDGPDFGTSVPEELFRRYTETDSRAPSPQTLFCEVVQEAELKSELLSDRKGRTTLVLDLRAGSHEMQVCINFQSRVFIVIIIIINTLASKTLKKSIRL